MGCMHMEKTLPVPGMRAPRAALLPPVLSVQLATVTSFPWVSGTGTYSDRRPQGPCPGFPVWKDPQPMCSAWLPRCTDPCILYNKSLTVGIYCAGNHEHYAPNSSSTYAYVVSRLKGCTTLTGTNYSPGGQILIKGFPKLWPKASQGAWSMWWGRSLLGRWMDNCCSETYTAWGP